MKTLLLLALLLMICGCREQKADINGIVEKLTCFNQDTYTKEIPKSISYDGKTIYIEFQDARLGRICIVK